MRLLWWRGNKSRGAESRRGAAVAVAAVAEAMAEPPVPVALDPVLSFARDYLVASGARVRQEGAEIVMGTFPDGSIRSFTSSVAVARERPAAEILVPGSAALSDVVGAVAEKSRVVALKLTSAVEIGELIRAGIRPPVAACGRCATTTCSRAFTPCDGCPLRDGNLTFRGLERVRRVSARGRRESWSVEVSYDVVAHDREGRLHDRVRVALDLESGAAVPLLTLESLTTAEGVALPAAVSDTLPAMLERAETVLYPTVAATIAFLALRAEPTYLARRDEVTATFEALRREQASGTPELDRELAIELQRLDDTFAVATEAVPASVVFVASDLVDVVLERRDGSDVTLTCDIGRGVVLPPSCAACGCPSTSVSVCSAAHVICSNCLSGQDVAVECAICAGAQVKSVGPQRQGDSQGGPLAAGSALSPSSLAALPDHVWRACVRWLADLRGIRIEHVHDSPLGLSLKGERGEAKVAVHAMRSAHGWGVSADEVRRVAAHAVGEVGVTSILLSPCDPSGDARAEAARLGVEIWDTAILQETLQAAAGAYERGRLAGEAHRERCLALLRTIQGEAVAALEEIETYLAASSGGARLAGRGQVAQGVTDLEANQSVLLQSLVAWDTVVADFSTCVGARPRRDGSLDLVAEPDLLQDLLDRARHVSHVAATCARQLGQSATSGDFGYAEWRKSLMEELIGRCEAARWRLLSVDLERADNFVKARDQQAEANAETARMAADRAVVRTAQALASLRRRARL